MENDETPRHRELHRDILSELGHSLKSGSRVLDFGCAAGEMVSEYRNAGYDAYGCDVNLTSHDAFLRRIDPESYRLPFEDDFFDFVFSDQVLEHVQDHLLAFSEMRRVMKPGAIGLHIFPSKLKLKEGHVFVPLGGLIQNRYWLTLWALLGIRNSFQKARGFREVVDLNLKYLRDRTNYLSKSEIIAAVSAHFDSLTFAEKHIIKHTYGGAHRIYPLVKLAPFIASLYSTFYCRVIFFQKTAAE